MSSFHQQGNDHHVSPSENCPARSKVEHFLGMRQERKEDHIKNEGDASSSTYFSSSSSSSLCSLVEEELRVRHGDDGHSTNTSSTTTLESESMVSVRVSRTARNKKMRKHRGSWVGTKYPAAGHPHDDNSATTASSVEGGSSATIVTTSGAGSGGGRDAGAGGSSADSVVLSLLHSRTNNNTQGGPGNSGIQDKARYFFDKRQRQEANMKYLTSFDVLVLAVLDNELARRNRQLAQSLSRQRRRESKVGSGYNDDAATTSGVPSPFVDSPNQLPVTITPTSSSQRGNSSGGGHQLPFSNPLAPPNRGGGGSNENHTGRISNSYSRADLFLRSGFTLAYADRLVEDEFIMSNIGGVGGTSRTTGTIGTTNIRILVFYLISFILCLVASVWNPTNSALIAEERVPIRRFTITLGIALVVDALLVFILRWFMRRYELVKHGERREKDRETNPHAVNGVASCGEGQKKKHNNRHRPGFNHQTDDYKLLTRCALVTRLREVVLLFVCCLVVVEVTILHVKYLVKAPLESTSNANVVMPTASPRTVTPQPPTDGILTVATSQPQQAGDEKVVSNDVHPSSVLLRCDRAESESSCLASSAAIVAGTCATLLVWVLSLSLIFGGTIFRFTSSTIPPLFLLATFVVALFAQDDDETKSIPKTSSSSSDYSGSSSASTTTTAQHDSSLARVCISFGFFLFSGLALLMLKRHNEKNLRNLFEARSVLRIRMWKLSADEDEQAHFLKALFWSHPAYRNMLLVHHKGAVVIHTSQKATAMIIDLVNLAQFSTTLLPSKAAFALSAVSARCAGVYQPSGSGGSGSGQGSSSGAGSPSHHVSLNSRLVPHTATTAASAASHLLQLKHKKPPLYHVKCIGDTNILVGGLFDNDPNRTLYNVMSFAFYILKSGRGKIHMRCAIADRMAMVGMPMGSSCVTYDVFGPAIDEASRMLLTCPAKNVCVNKKALFKTISAVSPTASPQHGEQHKTAANRAQQRRKRQAVLPPGAVLPEEMKTGIFSQIFTVLPPATARHQQQQRNQQQNRTNTSCTRLMMASTSSSRDRRKRSNVVPPPPPPPPHPATPTTTVWNAPSSGITPPKSAGGQSSALQTPTRQQSNAAAAKSLAIAGGSDDSDESNPESNSNVSATVGAKSFTQSSSKRGATANDDSAQHEAGYHTSSSSDGGGGGVDGRMSRTSSLGSARVATWNNAVFMDYHNDSISTLGSRDVSDSSAMDVEHSGGGGGEKEGAPPIAALFTVDTTAMQQLRVVDDVGSGFTSKEMVEHEDVRKMSSRATPPPPQAAGTPNDNNDGDGDDDEHPLNVPTSAISVQSAHCSRSSNNKFKQLRQSSLSLVEPKSPLLGDQSHHPLPQEEGDVEAALTASYSNCELPHASGGAAPGSMLNVIQSIKTHHASSLNTSQRSAAIAASASCSTIASVLSPSLNGEEEENDTGNLLGFDVHTAASPLAHSGAGSVDGAPAADASAAKHSLLMVSCSSAGGSVTRGVGPDSNSYSCPAATAIEPQQAQTTPAEGVAQAGHDHRVATSNAQHQFTCEVVEVDKRKLPRAIHDVALTAAMANEIDVLSAGGPHYHQLSDDDDGATATTAGGSVAQQNPPKTNNGNNDNDVVSDQNGTKDLRIDTRMFSSISFLLACMALFHCFCEVMETTVVYSDNLSPAKKAVVICLSVLSAFLFFGLWIHVNKKLKAKRVKMAKDRLLKTRRKAVAALIDRALHQSSASMDVLSNTTHLPIFWLAELLLVVSSHISRPSTVAGSEILVVLYPMCLSLLLVLLPFSSRNYNKTSSSSLSELLQPSSSEPPSRSMIIAVCLQVGLLVLHLILAILYRPIVVDATAYVGTTIVLVVSCGLLTITRHQGGVALKHECENLKRSLFVIAKRQTKTLSVLDGLLPRQAQHRLTDKSIFRNSVDYWSMEDAIVLHIALPTRHNRRLFEALSACGSQVWNQVLQMWIAAVEEAVQNTTHRSISIVNIACGVVVLAGPIDKSSRLDSEEPKRGRHPANNKLDDEDGSDASKDSRPSSKRQRRKSSAHHHKRKKKTVHDHPLAVEKVEDDGDEDGNNSGATKSSSCSSATSIDDCTSSADTTATTTTSNSPLTTDGGGSPALTDGVAARAIKKAKADQLSPAISDAMEIIFFLLKKEVELSHVLLSLLQPPAASGPPAPSTIVGGGGSAFDGDSSSLNISDMGSLIHHLPSNQPSRLHSLQQQQQLESGQSQHQAPAHIPVSSSGGGGGGACGSTSTATTEKHQVHISDGISDLTSSKSSVMAHVGEHSTMASGDVNKMSNTAANLNDSASLEFRPEAYPPVVSNEPTINYNNSSLVCADPAGDDVSRSLSLQSESAGNEHDLGEVRKMSEHTSSGTATSTVKTTSSLGSPAAVLRNRAGWNRSMMKSAQDDPQPPPRSSPSSSMFQDSASVGPPRMHAQRDYERLFTIAVACEHLVNVLRLSQQPAYDVFGPAVNLSRSLMQAAPMPMVVLSESLANICMAIIPSNGTSFNDTADQSTAAVPDGNINGGSTPSSKPQRVPSAPPATSSSSWMRSLAFTKESASWRLRAPFGKVSVTRVELATSFEN